MNSVPKLSGKVALITGAGRGIGRAVALKLASEGASIVVNDLDEHLVEETVEEIRRNRGQAVGHAGSVTATEFAERFVLAGVDTFGGVDIIVNNAGYTWDSVIQKMSDDQWDAILDVHLKAPFQLLRAAQPFFREASKKEAADGSQRVRKVVNISSLAGLYGNSGQVNYAAAKMGIVGLTRSLCKEWGRYFVTVNCVAYGFIETRLTQTIGNEPSVINVDGGRAVKVGVQPNMKALVEQFTPLGRGGTTEEAAGAVYLFCIPESDYVSGQVLVCGGGLLI